MKLNSNLLGPVFAVTVVVVVFGAGLIVGPVTKHFALDGVPLSFDYPASWTLNTDIEHSFAGDTRVALLGNAPWVACAAQDSACQNQPTTYAPGEIEIEVGAGGGPGHGDMCSLAQNRLAQPRAGYETRYYRVDGFPAIETRFAIHADPYGRWGAQEVREWTIGAPERDEAAFVPQEVGMIATYGDSDGLGFRLMLDDLAASFHIDGELLPRDDCHSPFPTA